MIGRWSFPRPTPSPTDRTATSGVTSTWSRRIRGGGGQRSGGQVARPSPPAPLVGVRQPVPEDSPGLGSLLPLLEGAHLDEPTIPGGRSFKASPADYYATQ